MEPPGAPAVALMGIYAKELKTYSDKHGTQSLVAASLSVDMRFLFSDNSQKMETVHTSVPG